MNRVEHMKKRLLVQDFIEQHPDDWEKLLTEKPYSLIITHDRIYDKNLVMFKYSQVDSDMSIKLVQECRGLILDEDTKEIVSYPFNKFFNFGEPNAAKIDWTSARIGQKIDGSLIKIVKINGKLLISTNGTIDAKNAPVAEQINCPFKTFEDIVIYVFRYKDVDYMNFEEGFTYMFELVSPWTRVVVPFKNTDMYFLGKRDNTTFEETYFTDDEVMRCFNQSCESARVKNNRLLRDHLIEKTAEFKENGTTKARYRKTGTMIS